VVKHGSALELLLTLSDIGQFYRKVTIGALPDDVLLEIFDFYPDQDRIWSIRDDWWHTLVHVCRRWRNVVFASPRRLRLQLRCRPNRSVKQMLDIWPELPFIISKSAWSDGPNTVENVENVIGALELKDRVSGIDLYVSCSEMERYAAVMQDPFPALTHLNISSNDERAPVISDSFLGGSAPRLQSITLDGIPFPALPNLLLSATDLVILQLSKIRHSEYISPEAMVTHLSALTRLKTLSLGFRSPRSRPAKASRRPPPLTRTVLPALTHLEFRGVTEYLEDLVARIDAPLLVICSITFFNQLVFNLFQFTKFLCRTETFTVLNQAQVGLREDFTNVEFFSTVTSNKTSLSLRISCRELDWQLSSLSQVCNSVLLALSTVENLRLGPDISGGAYPLLIKDDMENTQWLELLHPFTNVKDLHLSPILPTWIAAALQELTGERVTGVLPVLQNIFLDRIYGEHEPIPKAVLEFVAARQLSSCPVAIHRRHFDWLSEEWVVIESSTQ
jgi:hypothetical protein